MNDRKYAFAIEMANLAKELKDYDAVQKWYAEAWKELNIDDAIATQFYPIEDKRDA